MRPRNAMGLALAALMCLGAAPTRPVLKEPDWIAKPNGDDFAYHYPKLAASLGIEGRAVVQCGLDVRGAMADCRVLEESPVGLGFGTAVLGLTKAFRISPLEVNGAAVAGGEVRIPIVFKLPALRPSPIPRPEPPSSPYSFTPEALAVAREVVAANQTAATLNRVYDHSRDGLERGAPRDIEPATLAAGLAALNKAQARAVADHLEFAARDYATMLTVQELTAWRAYLLTPASAHFRDETLQHRLASERVSLVRMMRVMRATREQFCSRRDCATSTPPQMDASLVWQESPDAEGLLQAAPKIPFQLGLPSWAALDCKVGALGLPEACKIAEEVPKGLGVGLAALSVAHRYRLATTAAPAHPEGGALRLIVPFKAIPRPAVPNREPPPGPAIELARQFVASSNLTFSAQQDADAAEAVWAKSPLPGIDAATRQDLIQALRGAILGDMSASITDFAGVYAGWLTRNDLRENLAFQRSPLGQHLTAVLRTFSWDMAQEGGKLATRMTDEARAEFCAAVGCKPSPPLPPH